jgi:hypothetical protein
VTVATTLLAVRAAKVAGAVVIAILSSEPDPHPAMPKAQSATTKVHSLTLYIFPAFDSEIDCHLIDVFLEIEVTKAGCACVHAPHRRLCHSQMDKKDSRLDGTTPAEYNMIGETLCSGK